MHTDAAQGEIFAVEQKALAFDADIAKPNPVLQHILAEAERDVIELGAVRAPEPGCGIESEGAVTFLHVDQPRPVQWPVQSFDAQLSLAAHSKRQAQCGVDAVHAAIWHQGDAHLGDADRGHMQQGDIAEQAAIVEPVEMMHRHAIGTAAIFHLNQ